MGILLIGPASWVDNVARLLQDRTSHAKQVYRSSRLDLMRGTDRHIEIVTDNNHPFTLQDTAAIRLANHINERLDDRRRG